MRASILSGVALSDILGRLDAAEFVPEADPAASAELVLPLLLVAAELDEPVLPEPDEELPDELLVLLLLDELEPDELDLLPELPELLPEEPLPPPDEPEPLPLPPPALLYEPLPADTVVPETCLVLTVLFSTQAPSTFTVYPSGVTVPVTR